MSTTIKTLKVRVKDKHKPVLERMVFEANQVWNAANEITAEYSYMPIPGVGYIRNNFTAYDLQKLLKGIKSEQGFIVHSTTVQEVIAVHAKSRKQFKTDKLRWRVSDGSRRSLGWVPFKKGAAEWESGQVYFAGHYFKVWDSYGLSQYDLRSGSFSQDTRGR
ncbi:transposase [Candidatus Nitrosoglobus terrae]|uniref:Transposase n=1 Tax=Candidatus Nitrosoglobus terrae TaxID=1630141 RepID=A0A1Q2SKG7_9GAMM|nr:hypothetical protein [Candidatus Nitrosoglobus terrae]BAW79641.1 transposase [Candidatus Nitrosoglobus terrae]